MTRKRVLLVGSQSTLGRILLCRLATEKTVSVITSSRTQGDVPIELEGSITLESQLKVLGTCETVIMTAADFGGPSLDDFVRAHRVNSLSVARLLLAASEGALRHLILISTVTAAYSPTSPLYSVYGLSKRRGEDLADVLCSSLNLKLSILRVSQIYDSVGNCEKHQAAIYRILRDVQSGRGLTIFGSRDPVRNYIHIDDVVDLIVRILTEETAGKWECANPKSTSLVQIANCASKHLGIELPIEFDHSRPDLADVEVGAWPNAFECLGFAPPRDICVGIREMLMAQMS